MKSFSEAVNSIFIPPDRVAVFWAGQAGYVIKTHSGKLIGLDLYLSDCCNRYFGFKRIMPYLFDANDFVFDIILASHSHYDHFDIDAVPLLLQNGVTEMICAKDVAQECERLNLTQKITYLKCGEKVERDEIIIKAIPCDHGKETPYAVGFLITIGRKTICFTGDTSYRADFLENDEIKNADLLILPINGAFGNLNEKQAALVSAALKPKLTVPCHFWNFGEHGGNPAVFAGNMKKYAKDADYKVLRIGENIII